MIGPPVQPSDQCWVFRVPAGLFDPVLGVVELALSLLSLRRAVRPRIGHCQPGVGSFTSCWEVRTCVRSIDHPFSCSTPHWAFQPCVWRFKLCWPRDTYTCRFEEASD